jgi:hypothetical protein
MEDRMPSHVEINCARKGCYAIITVHPDDEARLRRTHETFYCPAGHSNYFAGKTTEEKRVEELERRVELSGRVADEWRERWEEQNRTSSILMHGVQVCPLGCGWKTNRRMGCNPSRRDVDRFLDRVGGDLTDHLVGDHNATRKPIALLPERSLASRDSDAPKETR